MVNRIVAAWALVFLTGLLACTDPAPTAAGEGKTDTASLDMPPPSWVLQGNIYEVNIRQYTPEGTFKAFGAHMARLKEMGVETLWFMPIQTISRESRKGELGSYYAVASYYSINPEFGSLADWKELVQKAHSLGFKVIIDWVPNHTGADHEWLKAHPDFYVRDSVSGKAVAPYDWSDVRELNYANRAMRDSMIESMKYWITETGIDGYRVDVAWDIPGDFWKQCNRALRAVKPDLFLLAEADGANFHHDGFNASYPWTVFQMMKKVASGERNALSLDTVVNAINTNYPANAVVMYFTSNHDENSWNKADYGTMPGAVHAPFAVFTQTAARSFPLIYSGQEEPVLDSISFFYKDTISFNKYQRAPFYKTLLQLRKSSPALATNVPMRKVAVGDEKALYAYVRESGGQKIFVILNLSGKEQTITVKEPSLHGKPYNVFMGTTEELTDKPWNIEPWGYVVYRY